MGVALAEVEMRSEYLMRVATFTTLKMAASHDRVRNWNSCLRRNDGVGVALWEVVVILEGWESYPHPNPLP